MSLTVRNAVLAGERVGLRSEDGVIDSIGPDVEPQDGDEVVDAAGMVLLPPMVNGHTHAAMTFFRSYGDDLPLMEWLRTMIWPAEAKLEPEDVYWGTRLAAIEMIRSGTTSFADMYWHPVQVGRAVRDAGLRALIGAVFFDGGDPDGEQAAMFRAGVEQCFDEASTFGPRVRVALGPHGTYTVSEQSLGWIAKMANEHSAPVHIHFMETKEEAAMCREMNGGTPIEVLDRNGLLGPSTLLAHGCWLQQTELELVAERGATIVTNPVSNMKLAVGRTFPYCAAAQLGIPLGLGTDGTSSNNSLDLFQDMKVLALVQKFTEDDPSVLPASEALEVARGLRSALLGGTRLEPGAPADFLLARVDGAELAPGNDLEGDLAYAATGAIVDTSVVDGRVLMRDREVEGEAEVIAEVRARAQRLVGGA